MGTLRKREFDIAKAMAIYMVVYGHIYYNVYGTFEYSIFKECVIGLLYYSISFWGVWGIISAARICKKRVAEICGYVGR